MLEFWPPKPKALDIAYLTGVFLASPVTMSAPSHTGSGSVLFRVAGNMPSRQAMTQAMVSVIPPAPIMCPVAALVELTAGLQPPNTSFIAEISTLSPTGVEVPCALMYPMSPGSSPAAASAAFMQALAPCPSGAGEVTW